MTNLKVGDKVIHKQYGNGIIEDADDPAFGIRLNDGTYKACHISDLTLVEPLVYGMEVDTSDYPDFLSELSSDAKFISNHPESGFIVQFKPALPNQLHRVKHVRPIRTDPREALIKTIKTIIGETAGAASLCWEPRPTGVFDSTQASIFVDQAVDAVKKYLDTYVTSLKSEEKIVPDENDWAMSGRMTISEFFQFINTPEGQKWLQERRQTNIEK